MVLAVKKLASTQKKPHAEPRAEPRTKPHRKPHAPAMQPIKNVASKHIISAKQAKKPKTVLKAFSEAMSKAVPNESLLSTQLPPAKELTKLLKLAIIGAAPFQYLTKQKNIEIFAISMRNLKYQLNKAEKPVTDPATKVPECYHDFLDVFSKETSDKVSPHSKYDHKIELLNGGKDHGQAALCGMSKPQLKFVKKFLKEHIRKSFIEASRAPCPLPILLAKKSGDGIRFCVDYRRLNKLTKKDAYPISLVAKTLAQLKKAKVFTKIDIC